MIEKMPSGTRAKARRPSKGSGAMAAEMAKSTGRRMQMTLELLQQLTVTVAGIERAERRFRAAIVCQMAQIDTTVKMICGAQIAEAHGGVCSDAMTKHAEHAEKRISDESQKLGLSVVKFIYGEIAEPVPTRGRKCKWSGWEI
jgi:hypothetical protein